MENINVSIEDQMAYVPHDLEQAVDKYDVSIEPARPLMSFRLYKPYIRKSLLLCDKRGLIAVSLRSNDGNAAPGRIDIIDPEMNVIRKMSDNNCVLVDSVRWMDDCKFLLAACDGEGDDVSRAIIVASNAVHTTSNIRAQPKCRSPFSTMELPCPKTSFVSIPPLCISSNIVRYR